MPNGSGGRSGDIGDGSGDSPDRLSKVFLEVELKNLNDGLPKIRRPLTELISEQSPSYVAASGEHVIFDRGDLLALSKIVPPEKCNEIRLPIVIYKEADSKRGVYTIDGNDAEISLLAKILRKDPPSKYLFRPDVYELGKLHPTIFALGFTL